MSLTETELEQRKSATPPDIKIISRVTSIPMVCSSWETINGTLSNNPYTRFPYTTAKGISTSAYKYTEPLQIRLAPLITKADEYANKAVDVVEARYPFAFEAKPEDVVTLVLEKKQSATNYVNSTIEERVKTPAYTIAQGIDNQFAPIVDYFEIKVKRIDSNGDSPPTPPSDDQFQYQRAFTLSRNLKDQIFVYSNDQIKQFHAQSALAQRATDMAQSVTNIASSSMTIVQTRIHALLSELQKLQDSTSSLASTAIQTTSQLQAELPATIQKKYAELSESLSSIIKELTDIVVAKDMPKQQKMERLGQEIRERVSPVLDNIKTGVSDMLARGKAEVREAAPNDGNAMNGTGESSPPSD